MRLLLLGCGFLVACGVTDAVSTNALDGTISVSVYQLGSALPSAGTEVHLIAPDDSVQIVVTDANGFAEAASPPNSRVVVFQDWMTRIFYAANPGDHIIVGFRMPRNEPNLGTVRFAMRPRSGWEKMTHPTGIRYALHVSCVYDHRLDTQPTIDRLLVDCPHATNATAVGWIEDAGTGELLTGASVLRNIDLTAHLGETIRMPAYTPKLVTASGQFINTPPDARLIWGMESHYGDDPAVFAFGSTFDAQPNVVNTMPSLGIGERTLSALQISMPLVFGSVTHLRVDAGFAANYFVDADASRRMQHISFERFNNHSRTIDWHPASDGQPPSMVYAHLYVSGSGAAPYEIELYAPTDDGSVMLPPLPPARTPQLTDGVIARAAFYRISNETYSEWLQAHSSRDPYNVTTWSPEMPREVWLAGF